MERGTSRFRSHRLLRCWLCSNWGLLNLISLQGTSDVPCAAEKVDGVAFEAKDTQKRHQGNADSDFPS